MRCGKKQCYLESLWTFRYNKDIASEKTLKSGEKKGVTMDIIAKISEELGIRKNQAEAAVKLIDEGNTIPFIARYRKEATGALNDEVLRNLYERLTYLRNLEERKETVLAGIEEQGKLTDELKAQIMSAETMVVVEDLYRPYKPKRRTRATIAKEKGLEPLAGIITLQMLNTSLEEEAEKFVDPEKEVMSAEDAIAGAKDIIAESISDEADYRSRIRDLTVKKGRMISAAKDPEAESVYEMYYEFDEPVAKLAGHRILALNRGENEKFLTVKIEAPVEDILRYLEKKVIVRDNPQTTPVLKEVIEDAYDRLIAPAIEREIRSDLTEKAEDGAIKVFGKNLEQLLMQPPIAGQVVLGWDPAFRTGCKLAVVDPTGKVLDTTVIYPTAPQNKVEEAKAVLKKLISKYHITLISLGNGTASRESEQVIVELLKEIPVKVIKGPGLGIKQNINAALKECRGEYIFLADQDDVWTDDKVEKVMQYLSREDCRLVTHDAKVMDAALMHVQMESFFAYRGSKAGFLNNLLKNRYMGCCMAFKSSLLPYVLPIPDEIEMHDQWIGVLNDLKGSGTCIMPEKLLFYRRHEHNNSDFSHNTVSVMIKNRIVFLRALHRQLRRLKN